MSESIESLTLRPRKLTLILLLLGGLMFVVAGIFMAREGNWMGYACIAFFGLVIPLSIIQMLPGSAYLKLDTEGFTIRHVFRTRFIPWSWVDEFLVININPMSFAKMKRVGVNFLHPEGQTSVYREISKGLSGSEDMLPDTYGKKAEELAALLNARLLKARAQNTAGQASFDQYSSITFPRRTVFETGNVQLKEVDISAQSIALKILRPSDYALVVICGLSFMSMLIFTGLELSVLDVVITLFFLLCAYTGWRHVGTIDASVWKAYLVVFPLLILFCFARIFFLATSPESNAKDPETFVEVLIVLWLGIVAVGGIAATMLLSAIPIQGLGLRVPKLVSALKKWRKPCDLKGKQLTRVNPRTGLILGAVGIAIILSMGFFSLPHENQEARQVLKIFNYMLLLGFFLLILARRYFQVTVKSLLDADKRAVILFLRSFDDDEKQLYVNSERSLLDFSLESRLSKHFSHYGPFIAVGSPNESLPLPGAARAVLSDDSWQGKVTEWINEADKLIIYAGKTRWVNWELSKIIEAKRVTDLIVIFPELKLRRAQRQADIALRVECLRDIFRGTRWSGSLDKLSEPLKIRALAFAGDGAITVIKSDLRNRDSYHLAAFAAHYDILGRAEVGTARGDG
jgi:hypothetical protein